jgi:hypothetical protein
MKHYDFYQTEKGGMNKRYSRKIFPVSISHNNMNNLLEGKRRMRKTQKMKGGGIMNGKTFYIGVGIRQDKQGKMDFQLKNCILPSYSPEVNDTNRMFEIMYGGEMKKIDYQKQYIPFSSVNDSQSFLNKLIQNLSNLTPEKGPISDAETVKQNLSNDIIKSNYERFLSQQTNNINNNEIGANDNNIDNNITSKINDNKHEKSKGKEKEKEKEKQDDNNKGKETEKAKEDGTRIVDDKTEHQEDLDKLVKDNPSTEKLANIIKKIGKGTKEIPYHYIDIDDTDHTRNDINNYKIIKNNLISEVIENIYTLIDSKILKNKVWIVNANVKKGNEIIDMNTILKYCQPCLAVYVGQTTKNNGHAVNLIGYRDNTLIIKNSWGILWENEGKYEISIATYSTFHSNEICFIINESDLSTIKDINHFIINKYDLMNKNIPFIGGVSHQKYGTCYAHASARCLRSFIMGTNLNNLGNEQSKTEWSQKKEQFKTYVLEASNTANARIFIQKSIYEFFYDSLLQVIIVDLKGGINGNNYAIMIMKFFKKINDLKTDANIKNYLETNFLNLNYERPVKMIQDLTNLIHNFSVNKNYLDNFNKINTIKRG